MYTMLQFEFNFTKLTFQFARLWIIWCGLDVWVCWTGTTKTMTYNITTFFLRLLFLVYGIICFLKSLEWSKHLPLVDAFCSAGNLFDVCNVLILWRSNWNHATHQKKDPKTENKNAREKICCLRLSNLSINDLIILNWMCCNYSTKIIMHASQINYLNSNPCIANFDSWNCIELWLIINKFYIQCNQSNNCVIN